MEKDKDSRENREHKDGAEPEGTTNNEFERADDDSNEIPSIH
jgi:hypothetical protein